MRLRRIALSGVVLGLTGVVVRAEGRAVGRVLLGVGDARVSAALGLGRATAAVRRAASVRKKSGSGSDGEVRV
ncbi:hypothetical protein ABZT02_24085 [Streptomyces sp. NPDC005402]|uniref:hypothetical protein n=1 Tax=Streptomyces sp. NPDC005402 TaxID=3155338 RepID=UPI0033ADCB3C